MDLNNALKEIAQTESEGRVRMFACECCRRLIPIFAELSLEDLILFGEGRSSGEIEMDLLASLRNRFDRIYESLYPGYGDPSPKALALSAAGEVAFTDLTLQAAINATEFAAAAIAKRSANEAADDEYGSAYDATYTSERAWQLQKLRRIFFGT